MSVVGGQDQTEIVDDIELPLPRVSGRHRELYDVLTGKRPGKGIHNASGALIGDGLALLRVNSDREYLLVGAVGDELYLFEAIPACSPCIQAIGERMTVFGPSPAEQERARLSKERERYTDDERMQAEFKLRRSWGQHPVTWEPGITVNTKNHPDKSILL